MRNNRWKAFFLGSSIAWLAVAGAWGQTTWQTTKTRVGGFNSGMCGLERGHLRVKVHPAHLEVEEDLDISVIGTVDAGNDAATLEIVGNFRMPEGAAITGALLWDGDRILEAKLLDRKAADSLYESMVERNSTPPVRPRDPLILELIAKDAYRLRIYPVKLGHSRHFRLRYQLAPKLGADGLEMPVQAAMATLFPGLQATIPMDLESGGGVERAVLVDAQNRITVQLPRTRFVKVADLAPGGYWANPWQYIPNPGLRLLPVDPLHQAMVRTRFGGGSFAGHYLNLYAGVDESLVQALGQRVEVVVLWKWHHPGSWIRRLAGGYEDLSGLQQAQGQAQAILDLHDQLGGPGMRFGLLHDDSRSAPKAFRAAGRGEDAYVQSGEYLRSIQGAYVETFVRGLRQAAGGAADRPAAIDSSKGKFLSNLRLVRTLYSPEARVVRHLLLVSAGADYVVDDQDMNAAFGDVFDSLPVSVGTFAGSAFAQAGFDFFEASRAHPYRGPVAYTPWGSMPALAPVTLNVVVRNERKSYDFGIRCEGGLALACGTLEFHGKSDVPWKDSLEWEAFDQAGAFLARAKTLPAQLGGEGDTAIATLWAGSTAPFSEKKEPPLGPVYGFVDRWASILALERDSLDRDRAGVYADSGVPRIANQELKDVLPNYEAGQGPQGPGIPTAVAARVGSLGDPAQWRLERSRNGALVLRIPGLGDGIRAQAALYDLHGRRLDAWTLVSAGGAFRWNAGAAARGGVYLLKLEVAGMSATKRVVL